MANQNDAVMLFVQDLAKTLQADPNEVIQIAQLNPEALKSAVEVFQQTQDIQQAAQAFQLSLQQLVKAAKHGAKLQYLKSLKNKCAEDEELYYFKKGGSVGCGCKKKEEGGKVTKTPEKNSSVEKFKNRPRTKEEQAKIDKLSELDYLSYKSKVSESNDGRTPQQKALKMKVEKKSKGSKMKLLERGSKCPKCGKVHSAGMGCSVAEFKKKFEKGGILKFLKGGYRAVGRAMSDNLNPKKSKVQQTPKKKVYRWTDEYGKTSYGSLESFNSWKKNRNLAKEASRKATKNFNSRPQVVRADRTAEGTQKPTNAYSKYKTFKEAYNAAKKNKDMYFDFKGKVYRSYDNADETPSNLNNNKADMIARYGAYLGWGKDPNFKEKSNLHVTDVRNGNLGKTTVEEEIKNNPAEPVEYNDNNLANWQLFENWKPEDYETLANKTAAAGAATAGALGASILAGPAMAYTTARLMPQVGRQAVMSGYRGPGSRMFSRMMGGNGNPVNGGNALQNWYWGGREGVTNSSFMSRIGQMTEGAANSVKNYFTTPVAGGGNSGVPQFLYFKKKGGSLKHIPFIKH